MNETARVTFAMTAEEFLDLTEEVLGPLFYRALPVVLLIAALLAACAFTAYRAFRSPDPGWNWLLAGFAFALMFRLAAREYDPLRVRELAPHGVYEHTVEVAAEGVRVSGVACELRARWGGVKGLGKTDSFLVFITDWYMAFIPLRAFTTPADAEAFIETAIRHHPAWSPLGRAAITRPTSFRPKP